MSGLRLIAALALVTLAGCGGHRVAPEHTGAQAELAVTIESHHWGDVVISIYRDGTWERVGLAGAAKTTTFVIPWRRVGSSGRIRLRAYAIGGSEQVATDPLVVQPGQVVIWTLESTLDRSSVGVY